jgi:hypothetical protein
MFASCTDRSTWRSRSKGSLRWQIFTKNPAEAWERFFREPHQYWDQRGLKKNINFADFQHKGKWNVALWIQGDPSIHSRLQEIDAREDATLKVLRIKPTQLISHTLSRYGYVDDLKA